MIRYLASKRAEHRGPSVGGLVDDRHFLLDFLFLQLAFLGLLLAVGGGAPGDLIVAGDQLVLLLAEGGVGLGSGGLALLGFPRT